MKPAEIAIALTALVGLSIVGLTISYTQSTEQETLQQENARQMQERIDASAKEVERIGATVKQIKRVENENAKQELAQIAECRRRWVPLVCSVIWIDKGWSIADDQTIDWKNAVDPERIDRLIKENN